jgi:hypothetical protein
MNVAVKLEGLAFPERCVNCGAAGSTRIERAKDFAGALPDDCEDYAPGVLSFAPCVCNSCAAEHGRELWRPGPMGYLRRLFTGRDGLSAAMTLGFGVFFLAQRVPLVLSAIPLAVSFYLMRGNWWRNARIFVAPATRVSSAMDFTNNLAREFEPDWVRFSFRNEA